MYLKKGNALLIIIILVVVLGLGVLLLARNNASTNYQNTPSSYQVTSDTSNAGLDKDMNAIDASLGNASDAANGVNQGVSDTPVAQPQ